MSQFDNTPIMQNGSAEPFYQIWIKALTKPNENTYAEIGSSPNAKATTAYLWVFLCSLVASFFSIIVQQITLSSRFGQDGSGRGIGAIALIIICGTPIAAAVGTGFFALFVALIQWIAKMFGGRGANDQLAYAYAAIGAPYSLVSSVFILFSAIPFVGICFRLILGLAGLYILVLQIMAVKGVNQIGWGQAAASALLPGFTILLVCGCVVGISLVAMGPAIANVFHQIQQGVGQ